VERYDIQPHVGVGPIKLGMSKAQVILILGNPRFERNNRYEFVSGFFVDFDSSGTVEFIELANSDEFQAIYNGVDLHNIRASKVLETIVENDNFDHSNPELGNSYIFKKLQLSLWRGVIPENDSDTDGQYFEAVGIGRKNYF
jgi:hypothetical protein